MTTLEQELLDFTQFAKAHGPEHTTLDAIYEAWRQKRLEEVDARAVSASLRDMEAGETGRSFDEFATEFRKRNQIGG